MNITNIPDFFFKNLNNIEIVHNEHITFDDKIILEINKNYLHKRGVGKISIIGKYNSYDDLKNFLSHLNVSEKFDVLIKENKIIIYQE